MNPIEALSLEDLLDDYEYAVEYMAYDPHGANEPEFSPAELRAEIVRRIHA